MGWWVSRVTGRGLDGREGEGEGGGEVGRGGWTNLRMWWWFFGGWVAETTFKVG